MLKKSHVLRWVKAGDLHGNMKWEKKKLSKSRKKRLISADTRQFITRKHTLYYWKHIEIAD